MGTLQAQGILLCMTPKSRLSKIIMTITAVEHVNRGRNSCRNDEISSNAVLHSVQFFNCIPRKSFHIFLDNYGEGTDAPSIGHRFLDSSEILESDESNFTNGSYECHAQTIECLAQFGKHYRQSLNISHFRNLRPFGPLLDIWLIARCNLFFDV
jgi:hypothetical protein